MTNYTKITDSDFASGALYDKVNDMADALNAGKLEKTALGSRKLSTAYAAGALVLCEYHGNLLLKCTTAGTTSSSALDTSGSLSAGTTINDGTVVWTAVETGTVKSVNGVVPDSNGNVQLNATTAWSLLDHKFSDYIINDIRWLRSDTFSWQSGALYVAVYTHLVNDITGITAATETVGSYTITYYRALDGHKIVLADQETIVQNIYNESGVAWYFVLDTTNDRFKLPRTKYGFVGIRDSAGGYIEAGLPDLKGELSAISGTTSFVATGVFKEKSSFTTNPGGGTGNWRSVEFGASYGNDIYGNSETVQPPATEMYLYFYVGEYTTSAIEQTAGINAQTFATKQDVANLVTSVSALSTDDEYPSAKCLYDLLGDVETLINAL